MNAVVLATFTENGYACLAISVEETWGTTEYIGRVPLDNTWSSATLMDKRKMLLDATRIVRLAGIPTPLDPTQIPTMPRNVDV